MIKKSILSFVIIFAAYTAFTLVFSDLSITQNQSQDNIMKSEVFIYDKGSEFKKVIVGSSLSARLVEKDLPEFYNLAFSGQSFYDGLEIIRNSGHLPESIFIEMNYPQLELDEGFVSGLYTPGLYELKSVCPSLRVDKKPLALPMAIRKQLKGEQVEVAVEKEVDKEVFQNLLKQKRTYYIDIESNDKFKSGLSELKNQVGYFEAKGVKIVFFEMPVNPTLLNLNIVQTIRDKFQHAFPESKYKYIHLPNEMEFQTTDGIHLSPEETALYTTYFKKALQK